MFSIGVVTVVHLYVSKRLAVFIAYILCPVNLASGETNPFDVESPKNASLGPFVNILSLDFGGVYAILK